MRPFTFPNRVNQASARLVGAGVVLQCVAFLVFRQDWQLIPLTYGFVARVASGPRFSPLGQLVTRVLTPRVAPDHRLVPGPPKRFAQGIGSTLSIAASAAWLLDAQAVSIVLIAGITIAATLESVFGLCLGCVIFNRLMAWNVIPADVCEACNDISLRWPKPVDRVAADSATS
ncbi:MAG: DUF4395 domain-containing protein [Ilumatobacteraceae bacterium]